MCLTRTPKPEANPRPQSPRKDPAVHVSLPSDAIVKQRGSQASGEPRQSPRLPSQNPSKTLNSRLSPYTIAAKTGEKPTFSPLPRSGGKAAKVPLRQDCPQTSQLRAASQQRPPGSSSVSGGIRAPRRGVKPFFQKKFTKPPLELPSADRFLDLPQ